MMNTTEIQEFWLKNMNEKKILRNNLPPDFPRIITLCGSTKFQREYEDENARLTLAGNIVISVGLYGHQRNMDMSGEEKKGLDKLHFRKIDISDEIRVINPGQYIGNSTGNEIIYAKENHKGMSFMENPTLDQALDMRLDSYFLPDCLERKLVNHLGILVEEQIFLLNAYECRVIWSRRPFQQRIIKGKENPFFFCDYSTYEKVGKEGTCYRNAKIMVMKMFEAHYLFPQRGSTERPAYGLPEE